MTSYWVLSGPGLPCGARKMADTALGKAPGGRIWLDVCILGQHLPQMYQLKEITELQPESCARLGLCPDCQGFGDTAQADTIQGLARGIDEVARPCVNCGGSGRPAIRVNIHRSEGQIGADIRPLPHEYVPPLDSAGTVLGIICLACGMPPDGRGPRDEPLHPGVVPA